MSRRPRRIVMRLGHRVRARVIERGQWADRVEWGACAANGFRALRWWESRREPGGTADGARARVNLGEQRPVSEGDE